MKFLLAFILAILTAGYFPVIEATAAPKNVSSLKQRLAEVKSRITKQEEQYREIVAAMKSLNKELSVNDKASVKIERESSKISIELDTLQKDYRGMTSAYQLIRQQFLDQLKIFIQRYRNVYYLTNRDTESTLVLSSFFHNHDSRQPDFDEAYFLKKVFDNDVKTLQDFKRLEAEVAVRRNLIDIFLSFLETRERTLEQHEEALSRLIKLKRWLIKIQNAFKLRLSVLIKESRTEKDQVELLIKEIISGDQQPQIAMISRGAAGLSIRDAQPRVNSPEKIKGQFMVPLPGGEVKQKFGRNKISGIESSLNSKGVEYSSYTASAVASRTGTIKFTGEIPGIGKAVIIEHPDNTHTLYGKFAKVDVNTGDPVEQGRSLGELISKEGKYELYFEVRLNGTAVDPLKVF